MRHNRLASLVALIALIIFPAAARTQPKDMEVNLAPRFEAGQVDKYRLKISSDTQTDSDFGGSAVQMEHEIDLTFEVVEVLPDGAKVDLTFERVKLDLDAGAVKVKVDSARPARQDEDAFAQSIRAMAGSTYHLILDDKGNVTSVTGGPATTSLPGHAGAISQPQQMLSQANWLVSTPAPGPGVVKVGQSWKVEDDISNGILGAITMSSTHTLKRLKHGKAEIEFNGHALPPSEDPAASTGLVNIRHWEYGGHYIWDIEAGKLDSAEFSTEGEAAVEDAASGVSITTRSSQTATITPRK